MVRAACHCGSVRITIEPAPVWVLDCNCSICRRYGALWAYAWDRIATRALDVTLVQGAEALEAYIWGDRELGFHRCRHCGCITHHTALDEPDKIRGVNARMFVQFDPSTVTIQRSDNAHTGWFWTRVDAPVWPGAQPPMPAPGPDDWL
jgi:hypothetical protein